LLSIPPEADPEELISQGARSDASSFFSGAGGRPFGASLSFDEFAPRPPWQANDGDLNTPWSSGDGAPLSHWWLVDVGKTYTMTRLLSYWGSPDGQLYDYIVEVSIDGSSYTEVASRSGASGQTTDTFEARGRYLRVTITDNGLGGADDMAWVNEFQVYGILTMPNDQGSPCPCENPQGASPPGPFNPRTGFLWASATDLSLPTGGLPLA
jgi:F5/8 type C domain